MAIPREGGGTNAPGQTPFSQQVEWFLDALMQVESGGQNVNNRGGHSSASGYFQYVDGTWNNYGGYARAIDAPYEVQRQRAREDATRAYEQYGSWDQVAANHMFPAWAGDRSRWNETAAPGNPPLQEYVDKIMSTMEQVSGGEVQIAVAERDGGASGVTTAPAPGTTTTDPGGGGASVQGIGSVPAVPDAVANLSDDDLVSYLNQNYGYLSWALSNDEVRPILLDIARGDITDPDRIFGQLQSTEWFQNTQASARQWEALVGQDPAEAQRRTDLAFDNIMRTASSFGINLPQSRARAMAEDSLRFGWNETELRSALFAEADRYDPGTITATADALGQMATQYLVPISDQLAEDYAKKIALGEASVDGWESYLRDQAASEFSGNASIQRALEQGLTVRQWADPYVQKAARTLEINPADFDLTSDRWMRGIHSVDRESGQSGPMSLGEWGEYLRKQPEWEYTDNARQQGAQWAQFIAKSMGAG